jgi:hypothetical protein
MDGEEMVIAIFVMTSESHSTHRKMAAKTREQLGIN